MTEYSPVVGDVVLVWGKAWTSRILGFVINKLFGVHSPPTHAEIVTGKVCDISAEVEGVVLKPREKTFKESSRIMILRHKDMTDEKRRMLLSRVLVYKGRGYDFYNHARWYLIFTAVVSPLVYLVTDPLRKWLKRKSQTHWHCSELTAQLYRDIGIETGYEDFSFCPPHHFLHLARGSSDWEVVWEK